MKELNRNQRRNAMGTVVGSFRVIERGTIYHPYRFAVQKYSPNMPGTPDGWFICSKHGRWGHVNGQAVYKTQRGAEAGMRALCTR
jgi:hypothetical protein